MILEKPFGRDLASARELNVILHEHYPENAVFRIDQMLQPAQLRTGGAAPTGIVFELIDGDGGFLAVHGSTDGVPEQSLSGMSAEQPIEAGGQRWHLVAFPTAEYMRSLQTRQPQLLGSIATASSLSSGNDRANASSAATPG